MTAESRSADYAGAEKPEGSEIMGPQTMTIRIYGASDDLVEIDSPDVKGWGDEFTAYEQGEGFMGAWDLTTQDDDSVIGLRVYAFYKGVWQFMVSPIWPTAMDSEEPIAKAPDWPITVTNGDGDDVPIYSTLVTITAPMFTSLTIPSEYAND